MSDETSEVLTVVPSDIDSILTEECSIAEPRSSIEAGDTVSEVDDVVTEIGEGTFDCLIYAESKAQTVTTEIATIRDELATFPLVVLLDRGNVHPAEIIDAGASEVVTVEEDPDRWMPLLDHRLREILDRHGREPRKRADTATARKRIEQLYEAASELNEQSQESDIFRIAVEHTDASFDFDACAIAEVEDGEFVPRAATSNKPHPGRQRLGVEDGIAGETYRTGETVHTGDVHAISDVEGDDLSYQSVLSVPMADFGVFQFAATAADAYEESDREQAELLAAQVENAIERVRFEHALTRERDRFAALFQNIPDAAVEYRFVDGLPEITSVNSTFVSLYGYEPDRAVGQTTLELLVPDEEKDAAADMYALIQEGKRIDRSVTRKTADGTANFLLRSVPLSSDDSNQRGYIIYTDIEELVQRRRELQRQNDRLDAFASMVSHDLRNPLNVATGNLDLLGQETDSDRIEVVKRSLDRMETIIDDLLTLARQGEAIGEVAPVELESVAHSAWNTVETRDATVSIGNLPTVNGDAARIQQLFENLFRNAVLHGGSDVSIVVDGRDIGFYVADDGPGIPDDMKDEVLDIGVSTAKDEGGTGIGLVIVTEIARAHGWAVDVADSDSGGAQFDFHIERADQPGGQ